jgi:hypothetical protein
MGSDGLEHIEHRHIPVMEAAGQRLVTSGDAHQSVVAVSTHGEFDRIRDGLATDR